MRFGVSFSGKQCRNFKIDQKKTLTWLINEVGFRRFRLMSYWNDIEKQPGEYDFSELDAQIKVIKKSGGLITLCLGARQPRWPENHWPDWVWEASAEHRSEALMAFLIKTVVRYKNEKCIVSWQLENEALLKNFGERPEADRDRLKQEYALVQSLDQSRPIIMTTSTSWGIPVRKPIPAIVGFSFYNIVFDKGRYNRSIYQPFIFKARAVLIRVLHRKPSFIHELQAEPWGPKAIWEMPTEEQDKSMSKVQLKKNIQLAQKTKLYPIDLWGGEWWYWRSLQGDDNLGEIVRQHLTSDI